MKIEFISANRECEISVPTPVPAKQIIPKWYLNIPRFTTNENKPTFANGEVTNSSVRGCAPFYDSLTAGYIQQTWCDIHVKFDYDDNNMVSYQYNYSSSPQIISSRENDVLVSEEFHPVEFAWQMPWTPVMPKGWSILFVHPLNRTDLPFHSMSGIIDSDVFYHSPGGNFPVYIKKSFNDSIIPAGTPMYQIIPIKRENWNSSIKKISDEQRVYLRNKMEKHFISKYKRIFHIKKSFK